VPRAPLTSSGGLIGLGGLSHALGAHCAFIWIDAKLTLDAKRSKSNARSSCGATSLQYSLGRKITSF